MRILNEKIQRAINFANVKHNNQFRKGTNNLYSVHPISVGVLLMEVTKDIDVICAGILHDTLEDTDTTEEEILKEFGANVLQYVKEASESDKSLPWEERKNISISKLSSISNEGLLVVLADKTHNLSSILTDLINTDDKEGYWSRFNRGYEQQKWYYTCLYRKFKELCLNKILLNEYNIMLIELFGFD